MNMQDGANRVRSEALKQAVAKKKTSPAGSSVRERQDRAELVIVATGVRACRVITLESLTCLKELLGTNTPNRTLRE